MKPRTPTAGNCLVAVCAMSLLTGCAWSSAGKVQDIDPLSLPPRLVASPAASPDGPTDPATSAEVYFTDGTVLTTAARTVASVGDLQALQDLLDDLTAGPNSVDRRRGLSSALPPATRLAVTGLVDGIATVDLTVGQAPPDQTTAIAQIVLTATSLPRVTQIRLTINGMAISPPLASGAQTDRALTRADYLPMLAPTPTPTQ